MSNYNNQGEAASYYASAGHQQQQAYGHQQQAYGQQKQAYGQQQQFQDDPDGERGFLGAVGGGIAGGMGGHAVGGKTGYNKTSTLIGAIAGAVAGHKIQDGVSDWKDERDEEKEKKKREEEEAKRRREEDDERRKREQDEKRRKDQQQQQHSSGSSNGDVKYAGGFSGSCKDISLDHAGGEFVLRASCRGRDGSYRSSSIALNPIISNQRGSFVWAAGSTERGNGNNCGGRPSQYTVIPGDTLRNIGAKLGVSWEELARVNGVENPDIIHPGRVLNVPGGGGSHDRGGGVSHGGNFGASARNVRLEDGGRKLAAELRRDGQWIGDSLVLDERIGNNNGCLVYKE